MRTLSLIGVECWIALLPAHAGEGVVTYKSLAPDVAFDLALSALQQCRNDGYQVAVVGAPLVELRDRYTPVGALDIAKGKAWTSVTFTRNTSDFVKSHERQHDERRLGRLARRDAACRRPRHRGRRFAPRWRRRRGRAWRRKGRGMRKGWPHRGTGQARLLANGSPLRGSYPQEWQTHQRRLIF